jgi:hypothetical protein
MISQSAMILSGFVFFDKVRAPVSTSPGKTRILSSNRSIMVHHDESFTIFNDRYIYIAVLFCNKL